MYDEAYPTSSGFTAMGRVRIAVLQRRATASRTATTMATGLHTRAELTKAGRGNCTKVFKDICWIRVGRLPFPTEWKPDMG